MKKPGYKAGFGIMEVLVAAVVLGFLVVALLQLQKGNREAIIRIRARDAAVDVAQEVIESIAARGLASIRAGRFACNIGDGDEIEEDENLCNIERNFEGVHGKSVPVRFQPEVFVIDEEGNEEEVADSKSYYESKEEGFGTRHIFTKKIDVTVRWQFRDSEQAITVSTVLR